MAASKQFDAFFDNGLNSPFAEGADMYSYFIIRGNTFKSKNLFHPMQEKKAVTKRRNFGLAELTMFTFKHTYHVKAKILISMEWNSLLVNENVCSFGSPFHGNSVEDVSEWRFLFHRVMESSSVLFSYSILFLASYFHSTC